MIDEPEIVTTEPQRAAVIHLSIPRNKIQEEMGPGHNELMSALKAQGVAPAGPWFTHHLRMDPAVFDFEIGVPVAAEVKATGRVKPGVLPAAKVARTTYRGGYEGLGSAWGEFEAWIKKQGHAAAPDLWEVYAAGPETGNDPNLYRTELNRPLK
ncbi:MAG TPA: GyrI-like domain-containing protein [Gemmatimonadaceae bacterium]